MSAKHLTVQHSSLFVFDTPVNKVSDARKLFTTGADIMTGTESGPASGATRSALRAASYDAGYLFHNPGDQDCWVAISEDLVADDAKIQMGLIDHVPAAKAWGDPNGPYSAKGLPWMSAQTRFGKRITVGAGHWLTKGRDRAQTPPGKYNHYLINKRIAGEVGEWARVAGQGRGIVFYGADTNLVDRTSDVFRGMASMTTCWDEVGEWPGTGHGNIDVIASYDGDKRVECVGARVWDDKQFRLNTDHFMITARYRVTL